MLNCIFQLFSGVKLFLLLHNPSFVFCWHFLANRLRKTSFSYPWFFKYLKYSVCFSQIQTVKTQELNLLREQNLALNAELQQRRTEQESFLAQRDDLNSQLQVFWYNIVKHSEKCCICIQIIHKNDLTTSW